MGIHIIKMPDIGEGIAEVELVGWHVQVGDTIREDQALADVMTDKAAVEIPSPVSGTVLSLGGALGEMMVVGSELIRIEVEGDGNARGNEAPAAPAASVEPETTTPPQPAVTGQGEAQQPPSHSLSPEPRRFGQAPLASPAVRRRAWDMGIELQFVHGTGPDCRILHEDLDAHMARAHADVGGGGVDARYVARGGTHDVPVIGLRRKIAEKMQESKRRIPHFTYVEEVDVTELEALRVQLNADYGQQRGKLTVLPFIARAMVLALRDFPQINARFDDEAGVVTRYDGVHLGIAAQTANGLVVPVLRHAESRDLWGNAAEVARLAEAARSGKAKREELSGSTITLSSLGALGGIVSTPVINYPEVGIVNVNRMLEKPVVMGSQIVIRKTMNLSSSFDHRVVDGMDAARFIQSVRAFLQAPATLFVN